MPKLFLTGFMTRSLIKLSWRIQRRHWNNFGSRHAEHIYLNSWVKLMHAFECIIFFSWNLWLWRCFLLSNISSFICKFGNSTFQQKWHHCSKAQLKFAWLVWDTSEFSLSSGKPVMIVTEYMENGSLDGFLRVSVTRWAHLMRLHYVWSEEKHRGLILK